MGGSRGTFIKYPRTPHLFGARGTDDDKHLSQAKSNQFIADDSLIVEERVDGTNVGIHFSDKGQLVLQCRGHLITEGMHPQYDLFKQWATVKRYVLEQRLENRFLLFGEWVYARHSVFYRQLTHYFFEFDIFEMVLSPGGRSSSVRSLWKRSREACTGSIRRWYRTSLPTVWISGHELADTQAPIARQHSGVGGIPALVSGDGGLRPGCRVAFRR